jgi:hypothetical protein
MLQIARDQLGTDLDVLVVSWEEAAAPEPNTLASKQAGSNGVGVQSGAKNCV